MIKLTKETQECLSSLSNTQIYTLISAIEYFKRFVKARKFKVVKRLNILTLTRKDGICDNLVSCVIRLSNENIEIPNVYLCVLKIADSWQYKSGSCNYPVPHELLTPSGAYYNTVDLWDRRTKYGRRRWELLEFINDVLRQELDERFKRFEEKFDLKLNEE